MMPHMAANQFWYQYECPALSYQTLWPRLKYSKSRTNSDVKVMRLEKCWYQMKGMHVHMWNMKAQVKCSKLNVGAKVMRSNLLIPNERSFHKVYACEIWKLLHRVQKLWPKLNFLRKNRQTDRPKSMCPDSPITGA